jgi:hypothetical protein
MVRSVHIRLVVASGAASSYSPAEQVVVVVHSRFDVVVGAAL